MLQRPKRGNDHSPEEVLVDFRGRCALPHGRRCGNGTRNWLDGSNGAILPVLRKGAANTRRDSVESRIRPARHSVILKFPAYAIRANPRSSSGLTCPKCDKKHSPLFLCPYESHAAFTTRKKTGSITTSPSSRRWTPPWQTAPPRPP